MRNVWSNVNNRNKYESVNIKVLMKILSKDNKGSTMVETIVSFVILMIVFAALTGMVKFSSNLKMRAVDTANVENSFIDELYKSESVAKKNITEHRYLGAAAEDDNYPMFTLKLDTNVTDSTNLIIGQETMTKEEKAFYTNSIFLSDIDGICYVSEDSRIADEKLASPKALIFRYHK